MRWQVHGRVKVGWDLVEPRGIKLGDNVRLMFLRLRLGVFLRKLEH